MTSPLRPSRYYLADEPGGQHIDPGLLEKSYDFVKSLDPHKPVTMVFCCVDPKQYINSFDIGQYFTHQPIGQQIGHDLVPSHRDG